MTDLILYVCTWVSTTKNMCRKEKELYCVFHRFRQNKFAYGGSILSSPQFLLLPNDRYKSGQNWLENNHLFYEETLVIKIVEIQVKYLHSIFWLSNSVIPNRGAARRCHGCRQVLNYCLFIDVLLHSVPPNLSFLTN